MTPRKAGVLAASLVGDPSTRVGAAVLGWERPATREQLILMDLFDLTHRKAAQRDVEPYPRPWPDPSARRRGRTTLPREQVLAILAEHGHFRD